ncbi:MAG: TetR/AcrR family transcriptional regulator [Planctomycetota bacterium]
MATETRSAKDRILDAANRLFYDEGIRAVSVDSIAAKAGITKKTLYYHFESKDNLIEAYLKSRDQPNLALFKKWFDEAGGGLPDKVEAIFLNLAQSARHPKWKGCGFLRTAAELANMPGHPAVKVGAAHKKKFEAWLSGVFRDHSVAEPDELACHVVLLMDGAFSTVLVHRDPAYFEAASRVSKGIVANAVQSHTLL